MARAKMIAAGALLGTGTAIALINTSILLNRNTSTDSRLLSGMALVFFGLPPIAIGSVLVLNVQLEAKRERDRLQTTFYKLVKANYGKMNALEFAMQAKVSGAEAKAFLDDRAKEFNARFDVSEEGKVLYYFDLAADATSANSEKTYDVMLERPSDGWDTPFWGSSILTDVERCAKDLPVEVRKQIKRAKYPVTIATGLSKEEAKKLRKDLEFYPRLNVEIQQTE